MGSLEDFMKEINKEFGDEVIHMGVSAYDYKRIPFTSPRMNYMTYGGIPRGMLIEFFGEEHGGKTTTALDIVSNYQRLDDAKMVMYCDLENTLDTVWAGKLGVDVEKMAIFNPTNQGAETVFEKILKGIETNAFGLIVIDSLGVMMSNQALEKSVEEKTYGGIAMALTNFSKKAEQLCRKYDCTIIGINQIRENLNSPYGGTTTPGGRAWKHNCSVRLEFRMGRYFDDKYKDIARNSESPYGNYVQVSMPKNKTCPPKRRTGFYTLVYDLGIDYLYDLTEVAQKYGLIEKSGAWYKVINVDTDEIILDKIQGQANLYKTLQEEENEAILTYIEETIEEHIND